ncbi:hypothetical protein [Ferrimonas sp. SCSIO 43195]|nr:hypothetical protein [Ferrimonas sp. SCSIO 43195]USD36463.1 hypothetical protein J8Z22_15760 [Ferrimonas sp. SCSIO 43195]
MKTPTRTVSKKTKATQQGAAAKAVDKLDGQQLVELAQEGVKAYSSYNELRSERERTIQVKADALKEMQQSDNEVRKQQTAFHQRSKELEVEQYNAETERLSHSQRHQQWQQDQQSREKTIAVLRAKVATGDASADEIVLLQQLHSASQD